MSTVNTFSIILPVKNGGHLIQECIHSILNQTYKDFNLLILENCSTDGSREWLESLTDPRIVIIPSTHPLAIEENWYRILQLEKNEFMTIIGHDDILAPEYLETMMALIHQYPDASLYQTHFDYIDSTGSITHHCQPMPLKLDLNTFLERFMTHHIDLMGTGFMMRSRDYDAVGGIPAHYPNLLFADVELWLRLTQISYVGISPKTGFQYRVHQSTTKKSSDNKFLEAFSKIVLFIKKLKNQNDNLRHIVDKHALGFIHLHCLSLAHRVLRTPRKDRGDASVNKIISTSKWLADQLIPNNNFRPLGDLKMLVARIIDSNSIFQKLFLVFKKMKPTPMFK